MQFQRHPLLERFPRAAWQTRRRRLSTFAGFLASAQSRYTSCCGPTPSHLFPHLWPTVKFLAGIDDGGLRFAAQEPDHSLRIDVCTVKVQCCRAHYMLWSNVVESGAQPVSILAFSLAFVSQARAFRASIQVDAVALQNHSRLSQPSAEVRTVGRGTVGAFKSDPSTNLRWWLCKPFFD